MKNRLTFISVGFLCFGLYGCFHNAKPNSGVEIEFTNNYIRIQNIKYRKGNAESAQLSSVGYLSGRGMAGGKNVYVKQRVPDYKNLTVRQSELDQEYSKKLTQKLGTKASAEIAKKGKMEASGETETDSSLNLKVKWHIISIEHPDNVVVHLNKNKDKRSFEIIKNNKNNARVITKVLAAYDYQSSETLKRLSKAGLAIKAEGGAGSIFSKTLANASAEVNIENKEENKNTINLSDGFIVGYIYDAFCWAKGDDKKLKITMTAIDRYNSVTNWSSPECNDGTPNPDELE